MSQPAAVSTSGPGIFAAGYDVSPLGEEEIMELAKGLNPEERRVLLHRGTEPAFCGNLLDNKRQGTYACRLCGLPLFASDTKFESGTGWPSFYRPVDRAHVAYIEDRSHGMVRTEIRCALRRAPGSRVWRRAAADARAVLSQLLVDGVRGGRAAPAAKDHGGSRVGVVACRRRLICGSPPRGTSRQRVGWAR